VHLIKYNYNDTQLGLPGRPVLVRAMLCGSRLEPYLLLRLFMVTYK